MDGHIGWLVTNHAMARELLADRRFSSRNELRHRTVGRSILSAEVNHSLTRGAFVDMDPPGHTRFRRLLTGQFTVRRMKQLEPRIEAIVEERLEAMLRAGPPADLMRSFATAEELLSIPWWDLIHPDDRARTREGVDDLARGQEVFQLEMRGICRDGSLMLFGSASASETTGLGADSARGSRLVGLRDRVEALGGSMMLASPPPPQPPVRVPRCDPPLQRRDTLRRVLSAG